MPVTINATRFNDLYSQVAQILGSATGSTYDWDDWYDEYKGTYWGSTPKATVLAYKDFVLNLYESNDSFSTSLGTRYGLYRKAGALGVAYWVNDLTNGFSTTTLINNFFYAASFSTKLHPYTPPPSPPAPAPCVNPAQTSDSLATYQPGQVIVYADGTVATNKSLVVSTSNSIASTINGWYQSDLGRPAEQAGLNSWYSYWLANGQTATKTQFDFDKQLELALGGVTAIYTYCQYFGSPTPTPAPTYDPADQTDALRSLTPDKPFIYSGVGTVVYDRGVPGYGYGQTLLSSPVTAITDKVDDEQYIALYKDIIRIDAHQNGDGITIDPYVVGDYATNLEDTDKVEELYVSNLETKVSTLETNRFDIDIVNQAVITPLYVPSGLFVVSSTRSLQWRTAISHIFDVDFGSESALEAFFNAGGEVRAALELSYTGSELKTSVWQQLMVDVGQIRIKIDKTQDGNGVTSTKGYQDLSTSYTRLYTSSSTASYNNNQIVIDALKVNSQKIQIKLQLQDFHGEGIDEYVKGTTTSTTFLAVPDGEILINGETIDTVVLSPDIVGTTISNF